MKLAREDFDLVLVVGYFRSALPLLSVVRHLSPQLRIALCFQPLSPQMEAKTGASQKMFERLCIEAGGIAHVAGSLAKCRLMLVQQYPYEGDFATSVRADIEAEEIWGVLTLAAMAVTQCLIAIAAWVWVDANILVMTVLFSLWWMTSAGLFSKASKRG